MRRSIVPSFCIIGCKGLEVGINAIVTQKHVISWMFTTVSVTLTRNEMTGQGNPRNRPGYSQAADNQITYGLSNAYNTQLVQI